MDGAHQLFDTPEDAATDTIFREFANQRSTRLSHDDPVGHTANSLLIEAGEDPLEP